MIIHSHVRKILIESAVFLRDFDEKSSEFHEHVQKYQNSLGFSEKMLDFEKFAQFSQMVSRGCPGGIYVIWS